MKAVTTSGTVTYSYDGDGKRATKTVGSATARYLYDVNRAQPALLYDGSGWYIYGVGPTPIARVAADNSYRYYHPDAMGSTRVFTDQNGATQAAFIYNPFGGIRNSAGIGSETDVAYIGEGYDSQTGLYNLHARQYDPGLGRFTSPDPLGNAGGPNPYAYAANNPTTYTDHSGLCPMCIGAVAGGAAGFIGYAAYTAYAGNEWNWKYAALATAGGAAVGATLGFGLVEAGIVGGSETEVAVQRLVPGGGLQAHEDAGGHTLARHVGRTDLQLLDRFITQPWIRGSSSFLVERRPRRPSR